jgi:NAD(P)-dependent dehydrogenase (short-subunit alcohol dehydrogenase family)
MSGKVCIVTGANSALGIGRATVHQFAQNGAKAIFICDFNDNNLETHKRELNSLYPDVDIHPRSFDAANEAAVEKVVGEAVEKYGRLDVFFANAGIATGAIFTETEAEDFMEVMRVNTLRYVFTHPPLLSLQSHSFFYMNKNNSPLLFLPIASFSEPNMPPAP